MNVNQEVDQEVATSQHQEVNVQEVTSSQNKSNIVKFVVDINKNMESLGINSLNISSNQEAILDIQSTARTTDLRSFLTAPAIEMAKNLHKLLLYFDNLPTIPPTMNPNNIDVKLYIKKLLEKLSTLTKEEFEAEIENQNNKDFLKVYYSEEEEEKVTRARGETIKNQTNKKIIEYSSSSKFKTQDISIFIKTGKRIEKLISLSNREWGIIDAFPNLDINFFQIYNKEYKLQRIYKSIQASDHDDTGSPRYYFNEDDDGDNDEMMID
ncbi:hypothetical protein GLOIN_2v1824718 [Rhizophagus irregularis DAOM 181602=DAOM 197198]|nr:hypothetical protein GLOIN_2v1824718 [Rhizophagus irregularis DAOM 181602=DAOM 197198]